MEETGHYSHDIRNNVILDVRKKDIIATILNCSGAREVEIV